jgi:hypothetical protein
MSLKEQLADYRAGWRKRVPPERQAAMERHISQLRNGIEKAALKAPGNCTQQRHGRDCRCQVSS